MLHVASPFPDSIPKKESDVIDPAINGTRSVFEAAIKNGVKKLVLTSAIAAIFAGHSNPKNNFDENDWSIPEKSSAYEKSKYFAEREAWKIFDKNKDKIKLTVINPGLVLGPPLLSNPFTSRCLHQKNDGRRSAWSAEDVAWGCGCQGRGIGTCECFGEGGRNEWKTVHFKRFDYVVYGYVQYTEGGVRDKGIKDFKIGGRKVPDSSGGHF